MERTLRVKGVPRDWDMPKLQALLDEKKDESSILIVKSLVLQINIPAVKTATVFCAGPFREKTVAFSKDPEDVLYIDEDFLGVTPLYAPPKEDHKVDIIAISSLGGHAFNSFKEGGGRHMWLRDTLPECVITEDTEKPMARIMIYGFDSTLPGGKSFQSLRDIGLGFSDSFFSLAKNPRPIVLIGHSLGGLIIKEALVELSKSEQPTNARLLQSVRGIAFFGVPSQGMNIDSLKDMANNGPNRLLLETIGVNSDYLFGLDQGFQKVLHRRLHANVVCYYETNESPTPSQDENGKWVMQGPPVVLVSKTSATSCVPNNVDFIFPINRPHSEIIKFRKYDSDLNRIVRRINILSQNALSPSNTSRPQTILDQTQQKCLQSLAFPNMKTRDSDIERAHKGTCAWLLENDKYKKWMSSGGVLWIRGNPGTGKSTLLKYALEHTLSKNSKDDLILSFFHSRGDSLQKTKSGFFRCLLHQILTNYPEAVNGLVALFEQNSTYYGNAENAWEWHENDLWKHLEIGIQEVLRSFSVWLFVDALDEVAKGDAEDIIKKFRELLSCTDPQKLHICFGCRSYPVQDWKNDPAIEPARHNTQDISAFVKSSIVEERLLGISETIISRASGVFLWASLVVRRVVELERQGGRLSDIANEINSNPKDLNNLYQSLVQSMDFQSLLLIQWVACASRPLSVVELQWALAIKPDCLYTSFETYRKSVDYGDDFDTNAMTNRIKYLGRGLVEVLSGGSYKYVQFIHQSVQDFFMSEGLAALEGGNPSPETAIQRAHSALSRTCIHYLRMEEFQTTMLEGQSLEEAFPFLRYVVKNCFTHMEMSCSRGDVSSSIRSNLLGWSPDDFITTWKRLQRSLWSLPSQTFPSTVMRLTAQHQMPQVYLDLQRASRQGIRDIHADTGNSKRETLPALTDRKEEDDSRMLLKSQASSAIVQSQSQPPFFHSAKGGFAAVAGPLLARSRTSHETAESKDNDNRTPLSYAAMKGQEALVRKLLATGKVDVNSRDKYDKTPLSYAVIGGHETIARLLLVTGKANPDIVDVDGHTPLYSAVFRKREAIARLLLDIGKANPDIKDHAGRTPLYYAVCEDDRNMVELLLDIGKADINAKDKYGRTPLNYAVDRDYEFIVRLFLDTGKADVNAKDEDGRTPLYYAVHGEHEAMVRLLLDTGKAYVDLRDNTGRVPLYYAVHGECRDMVELLLDVGKANVNSKDKFGRTALSYAVEFGYTEIVDLLVEHGAS